jgi:hypothetical protein
MGLFIQPKNKGGRVLKVHAVSAPLEATKITSILPSGCWTGQTCFILGGGPSLEGFDYRWLDGQKVIGINKTFMVYPSTVNYSMDYNFFDLVQYTIDTRSKDFPLHEAWLAYKGIKVFLHHAEKDRFIQGTYYVDEIKQKSISFDLDRGIYPGNNSGAGALMLAVALGCKRIGLLGYDLKVKGKKTHWHEGYGYQLKEVEKHLKDFQGCIDELGPQILQLGIRVVNLSPDSALQSFPQSDIRTFLGTTTV